MCNLRSLHMAGPPSGAGNNHLGFSDGHPRSRSQPLYQYGRLSRFPRHGLRHPHLRRHVPHLLPGDWLRDHVIPAGRLSSLRCRHRRRLRYGQSLAHHARRHRRRHRRQHARLRAGPLARQPHLQRQHLLDQRKEAPPRSRLLHAPRRQDHPARPLRADRPPSRRSLQAQPA